MTDPAPAVPPACDILVVGGGPVGGTLALGLAGTGLDVVVLEARHGEPQGDPRAIALSEGSRLILERLGVWPELAGESAPIRTIHISQRGRLGRTLLDAREARQTSLGHVVGYAALARAVDQALARATVRVVRGASATQLLPEQGCCRIAYARDGEEAVVEAALAVVADGGRSLDEFAGLKRCVHDYGQHALVALVEAESPQPGVAFERFTPDGPIALLPWHAGGYALVWTGPPEAAGRLCSLPEADFLRELGQAFGTRVGRFTRAAHRASYPLRLSRLEPGTAPHLVAIGNAAQTLHPVAGQGFNLGLRDAWELATLVRATPSASMGSEAMLAQYRALRRPDIAGGIRFTDFLVRVFSNDWPGLGLVRGAGLGLLDLCGPARNLVMRKMSLGAKG